ncbi:MULTISPECIES: TadE/TadG family type IV pilus assembly protein [unclassified Leisingera]|uniref:TadE/TadG family type IV pilus assembly protein n=1 Tax=unclassified Leisingera TaxID=2614906 RepID=UPI00057C3D6C|nr:MULTISPECIES: TadE/TadG family type IV pilus assembly protein [unclassified Leisingera]KIC36597.1 pilus assembly protein TadE [Leisingera sp. ANG-M7]MDC0658002.1 pilus assembly protein [Leisingera sp. SS27]NVK15542.1 pilus assembly protein [Paracoccaceae bacterium]
MTHRIQTALRRFRHREDGNATMEFAIIVPAFLMILLATVELGIINLRHSQLERAVDQTVRDIRLSTGADLQHDQLRDAICARSGFISNCSDSLRLEMIRLDPFNMAEIDPTPDCIDVIDDVQPVRSFENGQSNELMFLRACMKFNPIFPSWGLASHIAQDEDGRIQLIASSAFVQEPR